MYFFWKDINHYSRSKLAKKQVDKLKNLIIVCQKKPYYTEIF